MSRILLSLLILLASSLSAWGHPIINQTTVDAEAIKKLEREYAEALVKADAATLHRLIHDDYTVTDSKGKVAKTTKKDLVDRIQSGDTKYLSYETYALKVSVDGNTAAVTGTSVYKLQQKNGTIAEFENQFTRTWIKAKDEWQVSALQSNITDAKGVAIQNIYFSDSSTGLLVRIRGIGFGGADAVVSINSRDVSSSIRKQNPSLIELEGSQTSLNLNDGKNEVVIKAGEYVSPPYIFTESTIPEISRAYAYEASKGFLTTVNLTIYGKRFGGAGATVIVNGTDVSRHITKQNYTTIELRGSKRVLKLNAKSENRIVVSVNGKESNPYVFTQGFSPI